MTPPAIRPRQPTPLSELDRIRFRARREMPSAGLGLAVRRKLGQSLEFREHRAYQPGDDVRTIDWRASARSRDRLVRVFEAEERFSLVVIVDNRPEMALPADAPALLAAAWIIEALGHVAEREHLRLRILPMFRSTLRETPWLTERCGRAASRFADQLWANRPTFEDSWSASPPLAADLIAGSLPPAAAVVILTDGGFDDPTRRFAALLRRAQAGFRHVVVGLLDTWAAERALLDRGSVRLLTVGGAAGRSPLYSPTAAELDRAEQALAAHRRQLLPPGGNLDVLRWPWHADTASFEALARLHVERFGTFLRDSQIFARKAG